MTQSTARLPDDAREFVESRSWRWRGASWSTVSFGPRLVPGPRFTPGLYGRLLVSRADSPGGRSQGRMLRTLNVSPSRVGDVT